MRPRAGWLALSLLLFASLAHAQDAPPDAAKLAEAKKHMEAGASFYNDPSGQHKCEEAVKHFKLAYDLSGSLNALKAMGVCELELERDGDAIAHFSKFLEKLGTQPNADRAQVESDLKTLQANVAWVTVTTDRPDVRVTDVRTPSRGYPITNVYGGTSAGVKIGVHPGQHVFTASVQGQADQTWKVDIANSSTHAHTFAFDTGKPLTAEGFTDKDMGRQDQPTRMERPIPVPVYVLGGLTVALTVPTVIFMVRANGLRGDFDDINGKQSEAQLDDARSDVTSANLVADIFLGVTVASLAATAVLYFTRPEVAVPSTKTGIRVSPTASTSGGGAIVYGRF